MHGLDESGPEDGKAYRFLDETVAENLLKVCYYAYLLVTFIFIALKFQCMLAFSVHSRVLLAQCA